MTRSQTWLADSFQWVMQLSNFEAVIMLTIFLTTAFLVGAGIGKIANWLRRI